ncbi:hypothetical protein C0J52_06554 [Blattella germanica]|nr:hypothetical protein C0J52_06554 [Blattella germanica]
MRRKKVKLGGFVKNVECSCTQEYVMQDTTLSWDYMASPITMCINGHNICHSCKPLLRNCPTSRGRLQSSMPIFTAQIVTCNNTHPWTYKAFGCIDLLVADLKYEHEEDFFRFRSFKCPYY